MIATVVIVYRTWNHFLDVILLSSTSHRAAFYLYFIFRLWYQSLPCRLYFLHTSVALHPTEAPGSSIPSSPGFELRFFRYQFFSDSPSNLLFFFLLRVFVADPLHSSLSLALGCVGLENICSPHCTLHGFSYAFKRWGTVLFFALSCAWFSWLSVSADRSGAWRGCIWNRHHFHLIDHGHDEVYRKRESGVSP